MRNKMLWTIQILLAALFLFAGVTKFIMPAQPPFSANFMHFIGAAEILGALGLILPGVTGIARTLTPVAAAGLVIIMIGATALTFSMGLGALVPFVTGVLAAVVGWQRVHDCFSPHQHLI